MGGLLHPCYLFRLPLRVAVLLWVEELLQIEVVRFLLSAPTKRLSFLQTYEMTTIKNNELIVQLKADNPDWFD